MKIVPHFNNSLKPVEEMDIVNNHEDISEQYLNEKLTFYDIFSHNSPACFMKINTDLMEDAGIFKNDTVVIDRQEQCRTGKIVVVKVNNALMIRRYEKIKSGHMLYGDTKKISPLQIEEGYDQFSILGVVVYIIKNI